MSVNHFQYYIVVSVLCYTYIAEEAAKQLIVGAI